MNKNEVRDIIAPVMIGKFWVILNDFLSMRY